MGDEIQAWIQIYTRKIQNPLCHWVHASIRTGLHQNLRTRSQKLLSTLDLGYGCCKNLQDDPARCENSLLIWNAGRRDIHETARRFRHPRKGTRVLTTHHLLMFFTNGKLFDQSNQLYH